MKVSLQYKDAPSHLNINALIDGVLPTGLYSGGVVRPGSGKQVKIEPFVARTYCTIREDEFTTIDLSAYPAGTYILCLFTNKPFTNYTDLVISPDLTVVPEWMIMSYSEWEAQDNKGLFVVFARITFSSTVSQFLQEHVDGSASSRISLDASSFLGRIPSGSGKFAGSSGTTVYHGLGHTNYTALVVADGIPNAPMGDLSIVRNNDSFTVFLTGTCTSNFRWTLVNNGFAPFSQSGRETSVFGRKLAEYPEKAVIDPRNTADYMVVGSHASSAIGTFENGFIWYKSVYDKTSEVYQTGVTPSYANVAALYTAGLQTGEDTFASPLKLVQLNPPRLDDKYFVALIGKDEAPVNLGGYHITKTANNFLVYQHNSTESYKFKFAVIPYSEDFIFGKVNLSTATTTVKHSLNNDRYTVHITPATGTVGKFAVQTFAGSFVIEVEQGYSAVGGVDVEYMIVPEKVIL